MSFSQKLKNEIQTVALVILYFAAWFGVLILLKELILAEYQVEFHRLSSALVGALVVAKVVLVLEHVPLGAWVRKQPALVDAVLRTILYSLGVLVVLILEKAFDGRHEYGGFGNSLAKVFQHVDIYHVWANTICVVGALLVFNLFSILHQWLGRRELIRLFVTPLPDELTENQAGKFAKTT